jgi:diguanylate cyclase (GGDEF)-like protein
MSEDKTIIANAEDMRALSQPSKRNRACLVQYSGKEIGKRYPLESSEVTLGRGINAEIVIDEQSVSRQHAQITMEDDRVILQDLNSSNGTFVNDKRITAPCDLHDQDVLRLGTILIKYFAQDNIDSIIQDKIYRMATIDGGTQIFNKKYLLESLDREFRFSRSYQKSFSIIYYDLDHFKRVNDAFGHHAGDQVLLQSAAIVKSVIRKDDIFGRFGGEEFVILLPNTNLSVAAELGERVRMAIESHTFLLETENPDKGKGIIEHRQTISVGISELTASMGNTTALLEDADRKLYRSKQTGRNRTTV